MEPTEDSSSLNTKSAGLIIAVAFNSISIKDITRSQLLSASKTLKLNLKYSLSKEDYVKPLAKCLIETGYINIKKGKSFQNLTRTDIIRVKPF